MALDKFYITNPKDVKMTLEVTKTLKDWQEIHDHCLNASTEVHAPDTFAWELKQLIKLATKEFTKYDLPTQSVDK